MKTGPKILGELLVEAGATTRAEVDRALAGQPGSGLRLGALMVRHGWVDEEAVARCLALQLGLPYETPPLDPSPEALSTVRPELARRGKVLPLSTSGRSLRLAMADPLDLGVVDDVQFQSGRRVEPVVVSEGALLDGLARTLGAELQGLLEELPHRWQGEEVEERARDLERAARSAPVVRLVDHILARAVNADASDVHIEEHEDGIRVRYRLDGILRTELGLPPASMDAVLSRLKIMAGMDISVKRRPQDGGMAFERGKTALTLRVSSLPVKGGEKIVVRILDPAKAPRSLDQLGLTDQDLRRLRGLMKTGQGVILAAGPTGSGKSSTLFGALGELDREGCNLVTLEDPVEYRLPGANQVQVNPKAGLTFPAALRSVLRQDPDIIMVGEIRDRETAEIAMAAAVTGHLVLSTIHTVDAPGAITRLLNMGVPSYLLAGGLAGVVAQRLVRRFCRRCRGGDAKTCRDCHDGYRGRTGVFQVLVMTDGLREHVVSGASLGTLRQLATRGGMLSLKEDALRKVAEGVTSPHEVGRVIHGDRGVSLPCRECGGEVPLGSHGCPWCGAGRINACSCGAQLRPRWRFCPNCLRKNVSI
ncbi:MAG: Flp pilus assembly complex ATPase component TadA [Gemmatimonadetes bacterium]|nr:Flp pilus assembly complex ATPase component TadA [Gemmatimonadota bacterium]NNM06529.1 Flp pilus assembly complex ATPase component TadA [Gemmatimonadota bacterium]